MLIGSLIFTVHAIATPSVSKERLIEVTPEVRRSIVDLYKTKNEREPTAEEMSHLIDTWILNEVTYREALAQGLDKGDEMIRERIMQKMRLLVFGNLTVNDPTEAELKEWFEARRARYDVADVLSFYEVPFTGPNAEAEARSALRQIESGKEPEEVRLRAQMFADRPRPALEAAFGRPFIEQLAALPSGQWQVLSSTSGWHVVRLDAVVAGRPAQLPEIQTQVVNEWKDERARMLGTAAIRDMEKSYVIRRGEP